MLKCTSSARISSHHAFLLLLCIIISFGGSSGSQSNSAATGSIDCRFVCPYSTTRVKSTTYHAKEFDDTVAQKLSSKARTNIIQSKDMLRLPTAIHIRGGASNKRKKGHTTSLFSATGQKKVGAGKDETKKSALSGTLEKYKSVLPLTRVYITLVGLSTLLGLLLGDEATNVFLSLDPMRIIYGFQLWRLITAATFLGPPSIGWLMSAYYLFQYGSSLERGHGTAQHLVFLLSQIVFLSTLSALFGIPFFTDAVITAMLQVLSRSMPHEKVKWLIFTVPYWSLPYLLMVSDVLQSQGNIAAALPHVLGILSGHFYYFHKFVWPKKTGNSEADWLVAPQFLINYFDPDARAAGVTARKAKEKKRKQKGKGRKLGR